MLIFGLVAFGAFSGCVTDSPITVFYPAPPPELEFASRQDAHVWRKDQLRKAQAEADRLPVDFRFLVRAVVMHRLDSGHGGADPEYLTVLGQDPDASLLRMLAESGHAVSPGSSHSRNSAPNDDSDFQDVIGLRYGLSIDSIQSMGEDTYSVVASYFCGVLCGGGNEYVLRAGPSEVQVIGVSPGWDY